MTAASNIAPTHGDNDRAKSLWISPYINPSPFSNYTQSKKLAKGLVFFLHIYQQQLMDFGKKLEYKGEEALGEIEKMTVNAERVQDSILRHILTQNEGTEYLNKYIKGNSKTVSDFKKSVPVVTYKNIQPYIKRIANGEDSSLITGQPIIEMLCRSCFFNYSLHLTNRNEQKTDSCVIHWSLLLKLQLGDICWGAEADALDCGGPWPSNLSLQSRHADYQPVSILLPFALR